MATTNLPRLAVLTCDIEQDFGARTGTEELLQDRKYLDALVDACTAMKAPLSGFVVTSILEWNLPVVRSIRDHNIDLHAHSHTHDIARYQKHAHEEIERSHGVFTKHLGKAPLGYRAPQGVMMPGDDAAMAACGFQFSSSVFPALRRGVFDHRDMPVDPWRWESGLLEIPFAATVRGRRMVTASYLKLFGKTLWQRWLASPENLPQICVIDTHLHDFFVPGSFDALPLKFRLAYSRNKTQGFALLAWLAEILRGHGYHFVTMSDMYRRLSAYHSPA